jgi:hypothetical protein
MPQRKPSNGLYLRSGNTEGAAFGPIGIIALVFFFMFVVVFSLSGVVGLGGAATKLLTH